MKVSNKTRVKKKASSKNIKIRDLKIKKVIFFRSDLPVTVDHHLINAQISTFSKLYFREHNVESPDLGFQDQKKRFTLSIQVLKKVFSFCNYMPIKQKNSLFLSFQGLIWSFLYILFRLFSKCIKPVRLDQTLFDCLDLLIKALRFFGHKFDTFFEKAGNKKLLKLTLEILKNLSFFIFRVELDLIKSNDHHKAFQSKVQTLGNSIVKCLLSNG